MVRQLKAFIQRYPALHYPLTMSVGPSIRMRYFKRFVRTYLQDTGKVVLDAGFGRGEYLHYLERALPSAQLVGYDLAETETYQQNFAVTKQRVSRSTLQRVDLREMSDIDRFDLIYTVDVLEHIPNNERVLQNFYAALKTDGYLYLAMPYDDPDRDYILPERWMQTFVDWAEEEHIGELRNLQDVKQLLETIGFDVVEARYTFAYPTRLLWELQQVTHRMPRLLKQILTPLFNMLATVEFLVPPPKSGNLLLVAQKR